MATINIANCVESTSKVKKFVIENITLAENVEILKSQVAKKIDKQSNEIALIYCGRCLKDGQSLESQNIKPGVTIHVLKRPCETKSATVPHKMDSSEVQQLVLALRTAVMSPAFRETVHRLSKPEILENIIAATPGLADDPVAIAILQDPDLLFHLTDINSINRVVEAHPCLSEAVNHIAAAVNEEASSSIGNPASFLASAYLYSLDALSDDDDDMDSSQADQNPGTSSNLTQGLNPRDLSSLAFPGITQAQLASALAAVGGMGSLSTSQGNDQSSETSGQQDSLTAEQQANSLITAELFNQAMQEALSATTQAQLQQLRDMGISDDSLSLRALEMTGGDVHAALELIFGDFLDNPPSSN